MNFRYPGPLQQNINHRNLLESTYYLQIPHPNGKYLKMRLVAQDVPKLIAESTESRLWTRNLWGSNWAFYYIKLTPSSPILLPSYQGPLGHPSADEEQNSVSDTCNSIETEIRMPGAFSKPETEQNKALFLFVITTMLNLIWWILSLPSIMVMLWVGFVASTSQEPQFVYWDGARKAQILRGKDKKNQRNESSKANKARRAR